MARSFQVTLDAADPAGLADFWAEALGYVPRPPPDGFASWADWAEANGFSHEELGSFAALVDPAGVGPKLFIQRVPEPKTAKNRVHLDVDVATPDMEPAERKRVIAAEVERLVHYGATWVQDFDDPKGIWTVMLDPEGNEFCVQ